jgi:hypothetical protein
VDEALAGVLRIAQLTCRTNVSHVLPPW